MSKFKVGDKVKINFNGHSDYGRITHVFSLEETRRIHETKSVNPCYVVNQDHYIYALMKSSNPCYVVNHDHYIYAFTDREQSQIWFNSKSHIWPEDCLSLAKEPMKIGSYDVVPVSKEDVLVGCQRVTREDIDKVLKLMDETSTTKS